VLVIALTNVGDFSSISSVRTRCVKYLSTELVWALGVKAKVSFYMFVFQRKKRLEIHSRIENVVVCILKRLK